MITLFSENITGLYAYAALICLFMYVIGYCISVGSLFWLVISEIFPNSMRSMCMSFVAGIQWLTNFFISSTFLTMLNYFGFSITFGLYGLFGILTFLFIFFRVPETKGISLEVIELNLNKGLRSRDLGKIPVHAT